LDLVQYILIILAGLFATGLVLRFVFKSKKNTTETKQSRNIVGGDQAGRDINKAK